MAPIRGLLTTVLVALALSSQAIAHSSHGASHNHVARADTTVASDPSSYGTHHRRTVGRRGLQIESFNPPSTFQTFGLEGEESPVLTKRAPGGLGDAARAFVASALKLDDKAVQFRSGYTSDDGIEHAYVRQSHNDIPFANAVANVAFKNNKAVAFGSSFVKPTKIADSKPTVDLHDVVPKIEKQLDGTYNNHPISLEYLALPDGSAALVHVIQIQNQDVNSWYEAFVDAHSGELLSITDFTAEAAYRVLPIQKKDIREGLELLKNPQDSLASPKGWHWYQNKNTTITSGNNVISYRYKEDLSLTGGLLGTGPTGQSASGQVFDYAYNPQEAPSSSINANAARTNAFYIINSVHDFAYRYGFTERAFNFQAENYQGGGAAGDRVKISVQDASGTDNANFATPPDGQSGQCRMYIFTSTLPNRDGSMENDIVVHEMTHGITNRMTGGGTARCLQTLESGGMGEGWSDAMAEWTEQKSNIGDYVLGDYVTNKKGGIRHYPYSRSQKINPLTYASLASLKEVHDIGEVWANMLHNVLAALVDTYGWSATAMTNPQGTQGNVVYLHLFLDALALQPCNPTFVQARNAWIQADYNRYRGAHACTVWRAFASRGLGFYANNYVNDFSVPAGC
ncbi:metalloprotease [Ephemerocybe angulata]|uniref:Extracellular metalloproteinase n=1 Tax=Ephemerocybe angulata TaxID=980116 RepID=A0A8H6HMN7_9AGAR|nr:metalloprotease [Tulosesus angulatus]